jgi:hypothetical protein
MKVKQAQDTLQAKHIGITDMVRSANSVTAGDMNSNWVVCQQNPPPGSPGNAVYLVVGVRC